MVNVSKMAKSCENRGNLSKKALRLNSGTTFATPFDNMSPTL